MPHQCIAKQALRRGLRPNTSNNIRAVCQHCVFCDIWRLATVVITHVPLSTRYSASQAHKTQQQCPGFVRCEKYIEASLQTQRARVASIMSICTVEGAEESDGLNLAYKKCRYEVENLFYQEGLLEEKLKQPTPAARKQSRDNGCGGYYPSERRSSRVGIAI